MKLSDKQLDELVDVWFGIKIRDGLRVDGELAFRHRMTKVLEALEKMTTNKAAGQWLPIETAPRECGAKFIGLTKSGRAITAVPSYGVYDAGPVFRGWDEEERDSFVSADLVCWMPFPGKIAASPATADQPQVRVW